MKDNMGNNKTVFVVAKYLLFLKIIWKGTLTD